MKRARIPALCLVLLFLLTEATHAGDAELQAMTGSGQCGENIAWNLDAAGNLSITGTGDFYGEENENYLPWREFGRYIVSVSISDGIATVPDYAFRYCDYLESVTFGKDVRTVGEEAFEFCTRLTDISGAGNLETVGQAAFARCPALEDFGFTGLITIGEAAFYDSGFTSVAIPDSVTEIGESAFSYCENLESVSIGQGVTYLDRGVFACPALKEIRLSATVTVIDENAVSGSNLLTVYYAGTAAQWNKIRGGGADNLKYYSERVYFESTGPEDAVPLTFSIEKISQSGEDCRFSINVSGNGFQRINIVQCYYDKSGKFLEADFRRDVYSETSNEFSAWYWINGRQRSASVKVMVLDEYLRPLCPCGYGTFEYD